MLGIKGRGKEGNLCPFRLTRCLKQVGPWLAKQSAVCSELSAQKRVSLLVSWDSYSFDLLSSLTAKVGKIRSKQGSLGAGGGRREPDSLVSSWDQR